MGQLRKTGEMTYGVDRPRPIRFQCIQSHDPGRYASAEIFTVQRPKRSCLCPLDISRRPVIQENDTENVLLRGVDADGRSVLVSLPHKGCELNFEI